MLFCRLEENDRDLLGRKKLKKGKSKRIRSMKIGIRSGNGISTETVDMNVKGLTSGVAEGAEKEKGGLIGDITNTGTGGTGTGTGSVTGMETLHVIGLEQGAGLALL